MATYLYTAKDQHGGVVENSLVARSRVEALGFLRQQALTVVNLREITHLQPDAGRTRGRQKRKRLIRWARVRNGDVGVLCRQLAIAVSAGVALRDAIESISEDIEHPVLGAALDDVLRDLHEGNPFSVAIAKHPKIFGGLFVALIRAAEESGSMPTTLMHLAESLERREKLTRRIRSIVAYPVFIAGFFVVVMLLMTLFVLPKFQSSLDLISKGRPLPALTRVVFGANQLLLDNAWLVMALLAGMGVLFALYRRTPPGRLSLDQAKLKLPLLGEIIGKIGVARFCQNLAIMVSGGVPITHAMEIASKVCGNKVLENGLVDAREQIMVGDGIAMALDSQRVFPNLVIRMVSVGESSGKLPDVLDQVAKSYEDEVEASIMTLTSLMEPILICVLGGMILVLVLAIYMPMFTMGGHA